MQAFEFHFNPKLHRDLVFDSFCYEPVNIEEKQRGNLYIVGEIKHAVLPKDAQFLDSLASQIKKEYYSPSPSLRKELNPEAALSRSLKKTNEFLSQELQKDNLGWLGNLNLAVISLAENSHGRIPTESRILDSKAIGIRIMSRAERGTLRFSHAFNFTKTGDIKILLRRGGKFIDLCSNLVINEIEPYPLKVFSNVVSGELLPDDLILVFTQEIYESFLKEKVFDRINALSEINGKTVGKILKQKEDILSKAAGVFLLINLAPEKEVKKSPLFVIKQREYSFLFKTLSRTLNIGRTVLPGRTVLKILKLPSVSSIVSFWRQIIEKIKLFKISFLRNKTKQLFFSVVQRRYQHKFSDKISVAQKGAEYSIFQWFRIFLSGVFRQNLILIFALIFILLLGSFIFQKEKERNLNSAKITLSNIEQKVNLAQNFLLLKNDREANLNFQSARRDLLPLTKAGSPVIKEAKSLRENIENSLFTLSKLEKIENPQLFLELKERDFSPKNIFLLGEDIYIFSPISENLFKLSKSGEINSIRLPQKFDLAAVFDNSLLFFKNPNIITALRKNEFGTPISLENYPSDLRFNGLFVFNSNLYFWDSKNCSKIIKYPYLGKLTPLETRAGYETQPNRSKLQDMFLTGLNWANPENWFKEEYSSLFCPATTSITIDGSIWISADGSEIKRFYGRLWQESLLINTFPFLEKPAKIWASPARGTNSYLYILEPTKNRILIVIKSGLPAGLSADLPAEARRAETGASAKAGEVLKQFQSEKFDNLLDFTVSEDGKTIWLLNGLKIYKILF